MVAKNMLTSIRMVEKEETGKLSLGFEGFVVIEQH